MADDLGKYLMEGTNVAGCSSLTELAVGEEAKLLMLCLG